MINLRYGIWVILLWAFVCLDASAQTAGRKRAARPDRIAQLEIKQRRLERQVNKTEELLSQTRTVKKKSFNELNLLKQQIELRETYLAGLNEQLTGIEKEIADIDKVISAMEQDVRQYQQSYAKAVYTTYKTHTPLSILIWIMSASGFRQAFDRMMYFKEFSRYRKNQIFSVKRTRDFMARKRAEKEEMRARKQQLIGKRLVEKAKLDSVKEEKNKLYDELKTSERTYEQQLDSYKNDLIQIREQIRQLVIESQRAMAAGAKTEEFQRLSKNFINNRSKLPWPIPMHEGVITGFFGKTTTATGNEVINDGIYISTKPGQKVRAVFNGKVTLVSKVPMYGYVVIIQHGNFRTVYANLDEITVNQGDEVDLLHTLGEVRTNSFSGETQLYFQIYRDFNAVNPLHWLSFR